MHRHKHERVSSAVGAGLAALLGKAAKLAKHAPSSAFMAAPAAAAPAPLRLCCACGGRGERLKVCTACHAALFCNADCQRAAWRVHKPTCGVVARGDVAAVRVPASRGGPPFDLADVVLPRGDPLLAPERAATSQLLQRCGIALRIVRLGPQAQGSAGADN